MQSLSHEPSCSYELIDFGRGRKLESFGGVLINRPCPAANCHISDAKAWESAELIYEPSLERAGQWIRPDGDRSPIEPWTMELPPLRLIVRLQASGQLGLFPEHWLQWPWFKRQLERWETSQARTAGEVRMPRVLHLFAYTGATTLALAAMGAEVTHVDAMRSAVSWARENSLASNLHLLPTRWIVDDARKYVDREIKRSKKYDLILLDPPSYGHGAAGQAWSIQRDLEPLLHRCADLMSSESIGIVLTGHSLDVDVQRLINAASGISKNMQSTELETARSVLTDRSGKSLDCGYVARFLTDSFKNSTDES